MNITFTPVDDIYYGVEEYVRPVANIAIKYDAFLQITCVILNTFNTYSEHIVQDVQKALKLYEEYRIRDMEETARNDYVLFSQKVYNFYWTVVDEEFGRQIRDNRQELYYKKKLRYPDNRLHRYRGILFEEIVSAAVRDRFHGSLFCTGCRIHIDHVQVLARYGEGGASHKETIDVAGWNNLAKYGEFYECKVNPKRFGIENYKFFIELKSRLDQNGIPEYVIALASADAKEHLKAQKEYIESCMENEEKGCVIAFTLIGREDLFELLNYTIPDIV